MSTLEDLSSMMKAEAMNDEIAPKDNWESVEDMDPMEGLDNGQEALALEPEVVTDLPNCEKAFVIGNPFEAAKFVDYQQGDNSFNARGNCGLVSISNMLRVAGYDVTEEKITGYAIINNLCNYDPYGNPCKNGGTNAWMRQSLLHNLGIESDICPSGTTGSLEQILDAIDNNQGVVISVNAGMLWDIDDGAALINGMPVANHCVMVTGYARDAETGTVTGVFIADSGRGIPGDACRYLTADEFNDAYTNSYNSQANITRLPLKEV